MVFGGFSIPVILIVVAAMLLLRWRRVGMLTWAVAWIAGIYVFLSYGFDTPIPSSVLRLYMGIAALSVLAYVLSSRDRFADAVRPLLRLILEPRYKLLLLAVVLAVPALAAVNVYVQSKSPLEAPNFGRTVHPAPPSMITVHDVEVDLVRAVNPYRELKETDAEGFQQHLDNGRRVYYENCFFCHGDGMGGDGMYAYGLNPVPSDFTDPGVLPMLQSSFIFWRVSKGAPGLPEEAGPWDSAMPHWEKFLDNEEVWDVILFLYEFNGYLPRANVEHH